VSIDERQRNLLSHRDWFCYLVFLAGFTTGFATLTFAGLKEPVDSLMNTVDLGLLVFSLLMVYLSSFLAALTAGFLTGMFTGLSEFEKLRCSDLFLS
jgi:hypothetical protein